MYVSRVDLSRLTCVVHALFPAYAHATSVSFDRGHRSTLGQAVQRSVQHSVGTRSVLHIP